MASLTVLTDDLARPLQLARKALIRADDLIERVRYLSSQPGLVAGEPDREIAVANRLERPEELAEVEIGVPRRRPWWALAMALVLRRVRARTGVSINELRENT